MSNVECEKCGGVMEYKRDSSTEGYHCTNCDWNVVTTYIDPINLDMQEYNVYLIDDEISVTSSQIKLVAKIANCNYIQSKKILESKGGFLYKGRATLVKEVIQELDENEINYKIEPEFSYQ